MTIRQHLKKAHETIAAHHRGMSKLHRGMLAKEDMGDDDHKFHESAATAHDEAAEVHDSLCQECAKAIASDLEKLVPTGVSAINPNPGVRAIPRAGAPPINASNAQAVPPEFSKLVEVDLD